MPARTTVLIGPTRSGKTESLLAQYRDRLARSSPGAVLWISPSGRSADFIRRRIPSVQLPACFAPQVMTFARFAETVVKASPAIVKPIDRPFGRQLIRYLIDRAVRQGELRHFHTIADMPGLVDLVVRFIREWKRLEIWPEQFEEACRRNGVTGKDADLIHLYAEYQRLLNDHDLYDAEGRFWTARRLLRDGQRKPYEPLKMVVVDGFTDFTRTQHEILDILSDRVEEMLLSLPGEADDGRDDLFAKPRQTLERLRTAIPDLTEESVSRPLADAWPAMSHLERHVFRNPRDASTSDDAAGVEIVAATQPQEEIARIGGRIKRLLTAGDGSSPRRPVPPGDVAVVFRSLEGASRLVREVFTELGIPFALEKGPALDDSPALASLVSFLRLELEDWPLGRLLAVLTNNYIQPSWPQWQRGEAADAAIAACRRLRFFSGQKALLEMLEKRLYYLETNDGELAGSDDDQATTPADEADECRLALALLTRLGRAYDLFPNQAAPSEWVDALTRFVQDIGFVDGLNVPGSSACLGWDDATAWERLREALAAADVAAHLVADGPRPIDLRGFVRLMTDTMRSFELPPDSSDTGRVRVLSAASARTLSIPYLFVAGLSEKAFPTPEREDGAYTQAEHRRLAAAGLPLVLSDERGREEMLLFYEVVTRATKRLTLSYPALDAKAEPLLPSPFVAEVARLFDAYRSAQPPDAAYLSPVPPSDELFSPRAWRLRAVAEALQGESHLLAALTQTADTCTVGRNIVAGLSAIQSRAGVDGFGPYEGMLASDAVVERLAERFGVDRAFSTSVLERYMNCPYRFFLGDVLQLRQPDEAELEIDRRGRGSLLHGVLAALHRQLKEERQSPEQLDEESYRERCHELLAEFLGGRSGEGRLAAALTELDRRQLVEWIELYRGQSAAYGRAAAGFEEPPAPSYFEVAFGMSDLSPARQETCDPLSTAEPLELTLGERIVRISGMIDRIDLARRQGRAVFNVLDYKTGATPSVKDVKVGKALQLALYAMAAEELLLSGETAAPWQVGYWELPERGFRESLRLSEDAAGALSATDQWQQLRTDLTSRVHALVQGIRLGEFPVLSTDKNCTSHCPYSTVCRVGQARSLEKTWQPPDPN